MESCDKREWLQKHGQLYFDVVDGLHKVTWYSSHNRYLETESSLIRDMAIDRVFDHVRNMIFIRCNAVWSKRGSS